MSDPIDRNGAANSRKASVQPGAFAAFAFGLAPATAFLMTWTSGGDGGSPVADAFRGLGVPMLAAECLAVILAAREGMISRIRWSAAPPLLFACLIAWASIAWGTAIWAAPAPAVAVLRTTVLFVHLLFALSILYLFSDSEWLDRRVFTDWLLIGFVVFVAILLVFVGRIEDWQRYDWKNGLPALPQLRHFGYFAAAVLGLCLGRIADTLEWRRMAPTTVVAALAFWLAFWTGGRGALVSVLLTGLAGVLLFPALRRRAVLAAVLISLVAGWAAAAAMPAPHRSMGPTRMITATGKAPEAASSGRAELWRDTAAAIRNRPLLGYGEAQLRFIPETSRFNLPQPHNIVLQLLVSWGFLGAAFLLYPAFLAARWMLNNSRRAGRDVLPPFFAAVALAIYSFVDGTLFHVHSTALFAGCVGMALAPVPKRAKPAT